INSASLTINNGGTMLLDNTAANNNTRLPAAMGIALGGGILQFKGNAGTALNESLGTLTLGAGSSTLNTQPGAAGSTLTFAGLTRAAGAGGFANFTSSATLGTG